MIRRIIASSIVLCALTVMSLEAGGVKKPTTTKKDAAAGTVELYKNKEGAYRFRIKNAEGKTIAMPLPQMSWAKKSDALAAIEELKTILEKSTPIEVKSDAKTEPKEKE